MRDLSEDQRDIARQEFFEKKINPLFNTFQEALNTFKEERKKVERWIFYVTLLLGLILLIISHFMPDPYMQVGLFGASILVCFYGMELYGPVAHWLYDHPSFYGLFILLSLLSAGRNLFATAYWKSMAAFLLAMGIFVVVYMADYVFYPVTVGFYAVPLVIAAYFMPYPAISVGLLYAAAYVIMFWLGVPAIFPATFFYDVVILVVLACALVSIYILSMMRERIK